MEFELNEITTCSQMSHIYEAAYSGNVSMLDSLIKQRPHILHKTSQTAYAETPLHISSLLGHLQFTRTLVTHKPNLALEVDSSRMTPLHLACAEGHIHIVKELLKVNIEPCSFPDEEGRIPLHYAAMRGRTEVVQELIKAKPESLGFRDKGKSVFHLCVTYNHLETLKGLVESEYAICNGEPLYSASSDEAGNTILHLAIMLSRVEVVSYLLSIPKISSEIANVRNKRGLTAHDILEQSPRDFKICEMQHMLTKAEKEGFKSDHPRPPSPQTSIDVAPPQNDGRIERFKRIRSYFMRILRWIECLLRHDDKWHKEMRLNLSLVSTVITTISFQALINPPGGFIQQNLNNEVSINNVNSTYHDPLSCSILSDNNSYCPGEALFFASPHYDVKFLQNYVSFITLSFFSSLCVTLLLVSGIFPMKNKLVIWVASIGMCITLTSLATAYMAAISIIVPSHILVGKLIENIDKVSYAVWIGLLLVIVVLITLRFFIWVPKKCCKIVNKSRSWMRDNGLPQFLSVLLRILVIFVTVVIILVQLLVVIVVIGILV